jgi:hypothetical protein
MLKNLHSPTFMHASGTTVVHVARQQCVNNMFVLILLAFCLNITVTNISLIPHFLILLKYEENEHSQC